MKEIVFFELKKLVNLRKTILLGVVLVFLNNIGKATTERVVYRNHPERRAFGGSLLCRKINENHSRAVTPKILN